MTYIHTHIILSDMYMYLTIYILIYKLDIVCFHDFMFVF